MAQSLSRRASRGVWALVDQAAFALSGFFLNIYLGRSLDAMEYGAFAICYSILLLIGGLHNAFIVEPFLVFGSGKFASVRGAYLRIVTSLHWTMLSGVAALAVTIGATASILRLSEAGETIVSLGLASPFVLLYWLGRRASYASLHPRLPGLASLMHLLLVGAGTLIMDRLGAASAPLAFVILAASGGLVGAQLLRWLRGADGQINRSTVAWEHWRYGKWAFATTIAGWVPNNAFYFMLPFAVDLSASGTLKALQTITAPVLQFTSAAGAMLLPYFVKNRTRPDFARVVSLAACSLAVFPMTYWLLLVVFGGQLLELAYGKTYLFAKEYLVILGLAPIFMTAAQVIASALRSLELPKVVFQSFLHSNWAIVPFLLLTLQHDALWMASVGLLASNLAKLVGLGLSLTGRLVGGRKERMNES